MLLLPKQITEKPDTGSEIDWSKPINDGLVSYVLPDKLPFINLVTGKEVFGYNPSNLFGTPQATQAGLAPTNSAGSTTLGVDVRNDLPTTGFQGITAISVINVTDLAQDAGLWSMASGQNPSSWLDTSGGNLRVSAYISYSTHNISSTGIWIGGVRWNTDGSVDFINNGVITDSSSRAFSPTANLAIMTSAFSGNGKGFQPDDDNAMLGSAFYHRLLSDEEIRDLCENFYTGLVDEYQLVSLPVGGDTTAPILSSPTGTKTGSTTASGTVSTDEGNGTLYFIATINASETAATIAAGSSQAVSGTGSQAVSFTGLSPSTTYYAHYVHDDAATNRSNVVSSTSFTTDAAASGRIMGSLAGQGGLAGAGGLAGNRGGLAG